VLQREITGTDGLTLMLSFRVSTAIFITGGLFKGALYTLFYSSDNLLSISQVTALHFNERMKRRKRFWEVMTQPKLTA